MWVGGWVGGGGAPEKERLGFWSDASTLVDPFPFTTSRRPPRARVGLQGLAPASVTGSPRTWGERGAWGLGWVGWAHQVFVANDLARRALVTE